MKLVTASCFLFFLLINSNFAFAQPESIAISDDFNPIGDVLDNALNKADVLDETQAIVVRDGQILMLEQYISEIEEAQTKNISLYVCDLDFKNFKEASLPNGVLLIQTSLDASAPVLKNTFEKKLLKSCLD